MSIVSTLSKSVSKQYPNFDRLQNKQQVQLLRNLIKHAVRKSINQIHIPTYDEQIQYEIKKLRYTKRHKEQYLKSHKEINEDMVDVLFRLKRFQPSSAKNDFVTYSQPKNIANIEQSTNATSSNRLHEIKSDYTNITEIKSKHNIFKFEIDDDVFKNEIKLKNEITRSKIKLDESLKEIFNIYGSQSKSPFVKSLFHLYDFQNFLVFHQRLQNNVEQNHESYLDDALKSCYVILKNYYTELLLIRGRKLEPKEQLENVLLSDHQFMSIYENHPLMIGFHLLLTNSIDFSKLIKIVQKNYFDIFSTTETDSNTSDRIPKVKHDVQNFDYDYEILSFIKKFGKVKQNYIQRKYLHHSVVIGDVISRLESSGFLKSEIENNEIFVSIITKTS